MTRGEALKIVEKGLRVTVARSGKPNLPYVGTLAGELEDGRFWFYGESESEKFLGKVKLEEVSLAI